MILSDRDLRRKLDSGIIRVDPLEEDNIEAASIDLRLGRSFAQPIETGSTIDTRSDDEQSMKYFEDRDEIILQPNVPVLATTMETIRLPKHIAASVVGRSSLGRLFVEVHKTAGFCDPGFEGQITLEMLNHNPNPVKLYAGDRICQIVFTNLGSAAEKPYGHERSQYQGQSGATISGMQFE